MPYYSLPLGTRMVNRPPNYEPYDGPLDPQDVAIGTVAALSNAKDLLRAAQFLFAARFFAQSAVLAILGIEEIQKTYILLDLLVAESDEEIKRLWSDYRRHPGKQKRFSKWLRLKIWQESNPKPGKQELENVLSDSTLEQNIVEFKKQLFLYSDNFVGSGWNFPAKNVTKREASQILASAELALGHVAVYSPAELGIWKKHLAGFDSKSKTEKRRALDAFADELRQRGFGKPNWFDILLESL